jgi:hypothetical protein
MVNAASVITRNRINTLCKDILRNIVRKDLHAYNIGMDNLDTICTAVESVAPKSKLYDTLLVLWSELGTIAYVSHIE